MDPVVGALVGAVAFLVQTLVYAYFAGKNRRGDDAYRWRKRMEPVHLSALDWIYTARMQAAQQGRLHLLPPLPPELMVEEDSLSELEVQRQRRDGAP